MPLTDTEARETPPGDHPQKLFDNAALHQLGYAQDEMTGHGLSRAGVDQV